jgi:hypothetical protein
MKYCFVKLHFSKKKHKWMKGNANIRENPIKMHPNKGITRNNNTREHGEGNSQING